MSKSRYFSLTTYATEKQIQKVVGDHVRSIRSFCYIYHDQDEAEPHYHILMRTHSTWSAPQIAKWFAGLLDKEKKPVNTFCEIAQDMDALKTYILHQDEKSREEGKHEYSITDIKDFGFNDLSERKDAYDTSYEILNKVLLGVNPRDLVRYYGRDYLYHHNQYSEVADQVRMYEGYKEAKITSMYEQSNMKEVKDIE